MRHNERERTYVRKDTKRPPPDVVIIAERSQVNTLHERERREENKGTATPQGPIPRVVSSGTTALLFSKRKTGDSTQHTQQTRTYKNHALDPRRSTGHNTNTPTTHPVTYTHGSTNEYSETPKPRSGHAVVGRFTSIYVQYHPPTR